MITLEVTVDKIYTYEYQLTADEFREWEIYADKHPWLLAWSYTLTLEMFLFNYRRISNPNLPLTP